MSILYISSIVFVLITLLYFLGSRAMFVYGIREGFVSILVKGIENGAFDRAVGAMKGYRIDPITTDIIEDPTAKAPGWCGFMWIGIWPINSAMVFDQEQIKLINKEDGSIGMEKVVYPKSIYIPIQLTERLLVKDLETSDLGTKVNLDVVLTYRMTNAYVAKIRNRGSNKILKANTEEGLREDITGIPYNEALKLKNATSENPRIKALIRTLNGEITGNGSLSKATGYELVSINVVGVELTGKNAEAMLAAYSQKILAEKAAEASDIKNIQDAKNIERTGAATAKAEGLMVDQIKRRIESQKDLSPGQAMALAIEKTSAKVVSVGGGQGATALVNADGDDSKTSK